MIQLRTDRLLLSIFILIFFSVSLFAQSDIIIDEASSEADNTGQNAPEPLPGGYGTIELGMSIDVVEEQLFSDPNFSYRGTPDVTMLPQDNRQVIDCDGLMYVERGYFQFNDDKLYLITMVLDEEYVDHYSIYTAFKKKYGEPLFLDPSKTVWQDERVEISLERPLSIKYIDREVFQRLQEESSAEKSIEALLRQDFIDSF